MIRRKRLCQSIFILTGIFGLSGCHRLWPAYAQQSAGSAIGIPVVPSGVQDTELGGIHVSLWRPKPGTPNPAPLIVFSHGFHGSSTQSSFLMKALAEHGYFVVAPDHKDAVRKGAGPLSGFSAGPEQGFRDAGAWSDNTYRDRASDIAGLLTALKKDTQWAGLIDWTRVGLAGHSLGGYTVLGLAGGWPNWRRPEVKAVLALSPYTNPFLERKTLGSLKVPVMYQSGSRDIGVGPFVKRTGGAYDQTPSPAYYIEFSKAGHLAWTDLRLDFQDDVVFYSLAFLDKYLKGDSKANPAKKLPDVSELRSK